MENFQAFTRNSQGVLVINIPLVYLVSTEDGHADREKTVERAFLDGFIGKQDYFRYAAYTKQIDKAQQIWHTMKRKDKIGILEDDSREVRDVALKIAFLY